MHEKTILLVTLPAFCLLAFKPQETILFLDVASFSMLPLLIKDKLALPFLALFYLYHCLIEFIYDTDAIGKCGKLSLVSSISKLAMLALSLLSVLAPSPARYPYLWPLLVSVYACAHFSLYLARGLYLQFAAATQSNSLHLKKN